MRTFIFFTTLAFAWNSLVAASWEDLQLAAVKRPIRIGYFPGGFDPIHLGHQSTVKQALAEGCDFVVLYPKPDGSLLKSNYPTQGLRVLLAQKVYQASPQVVVAGGDCEEVRAQFDSLIEHATYRPTFTAIVGSDNFGYWHRFLTHPVKEIREVVPHIAMMRRPFVLDEENKASSDFAPLQVVDCDQWLVVIRRAEQRGVESLGGLDLRPVKFLQSEYLGVSSTLVRMLLARADSAEGLVDPLILETLHHSFVYRERTEPTPQELRSAKNRCLDQLIAYRQSIDE